MILGDYIQPGFKDYLETLSKIIRIIRLVLADNPQLTMFGVFLP